MPDTQPTAPDACDTPGQPGSWLNPLRLPGGAVLPSHILPGPMEGVTVGSFCKVMTRRGLVDCWITPFIRISTGVPRRARLRSRLKPYLDTGLPVVAQLMGTDVERLCGTARRVVELGAAGIDLNCACPSPTVVRHGSGGALLRDPDWIHNALCELRKACPDCGISIKLRTGFSAAREMEQVLPVVQEARPDFVILHFRTVAEMYDVVPEAGERFERARELLPATALLGSGDLFDANAIVALGRKVALDGVAPARGLLHNPWLLRDIETVCHGNTPSNHVASDRIEWLRDIAAEAEDAGCRAKGFVMMLTDHLFGQTHRLFGVLAACPTLADIRAELTRELESG